MRLTAFSSHRRRPPAAARRSTVPTSRPPRTRWASLGRRVAPYAAGLAAAVAVIAGFMWRPATVSSAHRADFVVIAGSAGLRWDDVNPIDTPTLWALASKDSIGALSVRSDRDPTCPADGWTTLGAGNFAKEGAPAADGVCQEPAPRVTSPDGITGTVAMGDESTASDVVPGALPDAVRCTVAIGPYAGLAAAHPYGRIDRYVPDMPTDPSALLSTCTLSIVDLGTVDGTTPQERKAQAREVDARLATIVAARPADSLLLVAGLSDTSTSSRLHVAIADGPGYAGGWLTSSGTGRQGYVQLVDLAPTALAALDRPLPTKLFVGSQAQRVGTRPADPTTAIGRLADADDEAAVQHPIAGAFFGIVVGAEIVLLIVAVPLLRRARRSAEPAGTKPVSPHIVRYVEALLVAVSLAPVTATLTDLVPWWRSRWPALTFAAIGAAMTAVVVAVLLWEPWRRLAGRPRRPASGGVIGPLTGVSAVIVAALGVDVLTGSHLQLNGIAGYSAAEGTRYAGIGAIGLGAFMVAVLTLAACVAHQVRSRRARPYIVAGIGALGVILVGSPQLGADAGGGLALTAAVCVATVLCTGGWLSATRLAWAVLAGLLVFIGFAVLDLHRPVPRRGPLGTLLAQWHAGTAGRTLSNVGTSDVVATFSNPLSVLVLAAVVYIVLALIRPWGGLMRLLGLYPSIRGAMTGAAFAVVIAGLVDGVGFTTAGAAVAVALPLLTLAALRVLDHADARTVGAAPATALPGHVTVEPDRVAGGGEDGVVAHSVGTGEGC